MQGAAGQAIARGQTQAPTPPAAPSPPNDADFLELYQMMTSPEPKTASTARDLAQHMTTDEKTAFSQSLARMRQNGTIPALNAETLEDTRPDRAIIGGLPFIGGISPEDVLTGGVLLRVLRKSLAEGGLRAVPTLAKAASGPIAAGYITESALEKLGVPPKMAKGIALAFGFGAALAGSGGARSPASTPNATAAEPPSGWSAPRAASGSGAPVSIPRAATTAAEMPSARAVSVEAPATAPDATTRPVATPETTPAAGSRATGQSAPVAAPSLTRADLTPQETAALDDLLGQKLGSEREILNTIAQHRQLPPELTPQPMPNPRTPAKAPAASTPSPGRPAGSPSTTAPTKPKLLASEANEFFRLLKLGKTPKQAMDLIEAQRGMAQRLGLESSETVRANVQDRNASGRWKDNQ